MAEIHRAATIHCCAPACEMAQVITSGHTISDDDVVKAARVEGWYAERLTWRTDGTLFACPAHKPAADAAEKAAYEWACRVTAEMNKVRRAWARTRPKVAAWLRPIVEARRDDL